MKERQKKIGRRRFLRVGVGAGLLLGAGSVLAWQVSGYDVPSSVERRLRALSPKEYRIVEAAALRILRTSDASYPTDLDVALRVDAMLLSLHSADRRDFTRLLHLLEHALPWSAGQPGRFSRASGAAQDATLNWMATGRPLMRAGLEAIKSIVVLAYFSDDRTWDAIGYGGPMVGGARA